MKELSNMKGPLSFLQVDQDKYTITNCVFHPKERYIFAVGGKGGKLNLCCALMKKTLHTLSLPSFTKARNINGLSFQATGDKIVVTCESRRLSIVDVEKEEIIITYDNCSSQGKVKQPLVTHPTQPHIAASVSVNQRGITLFDFRMPLPLDIISDLYDYNIGDLTFLDSSWPWGQMSLLSGASGQVLKVTSIGGETIPCSPVIGSLSALAVTPGPYISSNAHGFQSVIVTAGEKITCQSPYSTKSDGYTETFDNIKGKVLRAKYSASGGLLYTASATGSVAKFRRYPDHHEAKEELYCHSGPVTDFDISSHEDFLVSTSRDGNIALYNLGIPSHGHTQCWELT